VKTLDCDEFRNLIATSVSCSDLAQMRFAGVKLKKIHHCGVCLPCVVRRIAVHTAGLWDSGGEYRRDVFNEWQELPEENKKLFFEMNDFGRRIESYSSVDDAFFGVPLVLRS
jgi:hypothetical protein